MINNISFKRLRYKDNETVNALTSNLSSPKDTLRFVTFMSDLRKISEHDDIILSGRHHKKSHQKLITYELTDGCESKVISSVTIPFVAKSDELSKAYKILRDDLKKALDKKHGIDVEA